MRMRGLRWKHEYWSGRLLRERIQSQSKTSSLSLLRTSWGISLAEKRQDWSKLQAGEVLYIGVALEREGSFLADCCFLGSRDSLDNEQGSVVQVDERLWGLYTDGILSCELFCNQCTLVTSLELALEV